MNEQLAVETKHLSVYGTLLGNMVGSPLTEDSEEF
jgi:hypothetical protein